MMLGQAWRRSFHMSDGMVWFLVSSLSILVASVRLDVIVQHPACGEQVLNTPIMESCPCVELWDALVSVCKEHTHAPRDIDLTQCSETVRKMWNDDLDMTNTTMVNLVHDLYLADAQAKKVAQVTHSVEAGDGYLQTLKLDLDVLRKLGYSLPDILSKFSDRLKTKPERIARTIALGGFKAIVPVFWAGFAHSLQTRQVLDDLVKSLSVRLHFGLLELQFQDIEHERKPIGRVMRELRWAEDCHKSKHDKGVWLSFSKVYANQALVEAEELQSWNHQISKGELFPAVALAINYPLHKLGKTFLFEHELELLGGFHDMYIFDFKTGCSKELRSAIERNMVKVPRTLMCASAYGGHEGTNVWSQLTKPIGMSALFTQAREYLAALASIIGFKSLDHWHGSTRERIAVTAMLKAWDVSELARWDGYRVPALMETLTADIDRLEVCMSPGIKYGIADGSKVYSRWPIGMRKATECQSQCEQSEGCTRFTFYPGFTFHPNGRCHLFFRDQNLRYERTNSTLIISGRPGCHDRLHDPLLRQVLG